MSAVEVSPAWQVDRAAVLQTLGLNPKDPKAQALVLICSRYDLDPLLKHVVLIDGRPYITRDGYLSIAHRSEQLDGLEVQEEGEDDTHWWAKVAVYRKDMSRPFAYKGRYPKVRLNSKGNNSSNVEYGPEMAVKVAEVAALRRAFNVTGAGAADERWDEPEHQPVDPEQWFRENGWRDQAHHDDFRATVLETMRELPTKEDRRVAWDRWGKDDKPERAVTYAELEVFSKWLIPFARKAKEEAKAGTGAGDAAGDEPAPAQPSLEDAVGPDAPLVKR